MTLVLRARGQARALRNRIIHDPEKEKDQKFQDLLLRVIRDDAAMEELNFSVGAWWLRPGEIGRLGEALKLNSSIRVLDLGGQGLGADAAVHVAGVFSRNTSLTALHLGGNRLADAGAERIAHALRPRQELAEHPDDPYEQAAMPWIPCSLTKLSLYSNRSAAMRPARAGTRRARPRPLPRGRG